MAETARVFTPTTRKGRTAGARALAQVGDMLDVSLKTPVDVVRLTRAGIDPHAMDELVKRGYKKSDINWVVPARTLTHRRKNRERLTPEESGRWFRAAKLQALAREVLGDDEKALRWLHKPRKMFDNLNAIELMQTEAGGQLVEEVLGQLDAGYFA
jgi:putative toxin-antitoxin system antitoxin component (TIGR02293 family)